MTVRTVEYTDIPESEYDDLVAIYNERWFERLRVDPPMSEELIRKVKAIKPVGEAEDEDDYAWIVDVMPAEILVSVYCELCGWDLAKKILAVLREEGEVQTTIPSTLFSGRQS